MKNALKAAAAVLLIAGTATAASAQVIGVPGVDYGYPPYPVQQQQRVIRGQVLTTPPAAYRVYENGKLIGQDPDPNVRMMLEKDFAFQ